MIPQLSFDMSSFVDIQTTPEILYVDKMLPLSWLFAHWDSPVCSWHDHGVSAKPCCFLR